MGKGSRSSSSMFSQNNGGIAGSGVFGFFGSTVNCKSDDNSYYCNFLKFFNVIIMSIVLIFIMIFILSFIYPFFNHKGRKRK